MLLDFSHVWLIEPVAARHYLMVYRDVLRARAQGIDTRAYPVDEGREHLRPKTIEAEPGNRVPTGQVNAWGEPLYSRWTMRDGVATIQARGPFVRHAGIMDSLSSGPMTSVDSIAAQVAQTMAHPDVQAVILNMDSPGGDGSGVSEAAGLIYRSRGTKPIVAYADGSMCSAAYWIGAAADKVVVSSSAVVGSIGAYMELYDDAAMLEMMGLTEYLIVATKSPEKRPDFTKPEGREKYQRFVDEHMEVFGKDVAKFRGVPLETVWNDFGKGDVFVGKKAVKAGLADEVSDYETLHARLAKKTKKTTKSAADGAGNSSRVAADGGKNMITLEGLRAWLRGEEELEPAPQVSEEKTSVDLGAGQEMQFSNGVVAEQQAKIAALEAQIAERDRKEAEALAQAKAAEEAKAPDARTEAIESFIATARPKFTPADEEKLRSQAEAAYDDGSLERLRAFVETLPIHRTLQRVELSESDLKGTTVVPNPDKPTKSLADAAVRGANKNAPRLGSLEQDFGSSNSRNGHE